MLQFTHVADRRMLQILVGLSDTQFQHYHGRHTGSAEATTEIAGRSNASLGENVHSLIDLVLGIIRFHY